LPLTDARSVANNINTIKSNLAFAQLTALKESTKTGASGLGATTIKEFESLQNSIAALDPGSATFTQDLNRVETTYNRLLAQLEKKKTRVEKKVGTGISREQELLNKASPEQRRALGLSN